MADTWTPAPIPDVRSGSTREFPTLVSRFGDEYEQRAPAGIVAVRMTASLLWPVLSTTALAALLAFIDAHPRWMRIDYALPWESSPRKWTIESASHRSTGPERHSLTVELREVFDL